MKRLLNSSGIRFKSWMAYGILGFLHFILTCIAFTSHFTHPLQTLFTSTFDGIKNNFTLLSFVKSPIGKAGIFKYGMMNYPFGDYVYTTDSTPFFSVPFRWFCHHVIDLSHYTIAIFNFFIIANIIVCGLLAYCVFKKVLKNRLLAWIFALILPWTNFQTARIFAGHYNLSLTSLCVFSILLFLLWEKYFHEKTKRLFLLIGAIIFCYFTFLIHGYYIAIIPVFIGCMLGVFGIFKIIKKENGGWFSVGAAIIVVAATAVLAFITLRFTDGYFNLRPATASGYDWMQQKTNFALLFTHYAYQHFYFPVWSTKKPDGIELMCYLGNIGLYTMGILFIVSIFSQRFRRLLWEIQKDFFRSPVKAGIVFAGLILLSMSFGEKYRPVMNPTTFGLPFSTNDSAGMGEWIFTIILFAGVLISLVLFLSEKNKINYPSLKLLSKKQRLRRPLFFYFSSAILLFVMFGHYNIGYWVNVTNPLWVAHKFTKSVEQFRCMIRFAWPFYWSFYIWIGCMLSALFFRLSKRGKLLLVLSILLAGGTETFDSIVQIKCTSNDANIISAKSLKKFDKLNIDWSDYQAILPVPYFTVGCESDGYNYTIDDIAEVSDLSFQLSAYSHLPMMSGKLSRTPLKYDSLLMETVAGSALPAEVKQKMNHKPVLIFEDRKFLNDSSLSIIPNQKDRPFANKVYWQSQKIISENNLQPIDSLGNIYFYKWEINP